MDSPAGGAPQRRAFPRIPVRAKVRMEFPEERFFLSEWAVNLSPGGMFVRTDAAVAPGQRFDFDASLTPKGPRFAGKGQVLWVRREWDGTTRPPGFAVRFLALEEAGAIAIQRLADVFLAQGVAAMQQELANLRSEWHARQLEEESTGEIPVPTVTEMLPATEVLQVAWTPADDEETATVPETTAGATGDGQGDGTAAAETAASPEPSSGQATSSAPQPTRGNRRRAWWIGAVLLALAGTALVAWRVQRPPVREVVPQREAVPLPQRIVATAEPAAAVPPAAAPAARVLAVVPVAARQPPAAVPAATLALAAAPAEKRPAPAGAVAAGVHAEPPPVAAVALRSVTWTGGGDDLWVVLALDAPIAVSAVKRFRLGGDPPREVIQLLGARLGGVPATVPVHAALLEQVRVARHPGEGGNDELRVVLDLTSDAVELREVRPEGSSLRLHLAAPAPAAAAPAPAAAAAAPSSAPTPGLSVDYERP